jgi:hypothetical protein
VNPRITRRFRFPSHVGVLDAQLPSTPWSPPPLLADASPRLTPAGAGRPTVSIIRSGRNR